MQKTTTCLFLIHAPPSSSLPFFLALFPFYLALLSNQWTHIILVIQEVQQHMGWKGEKLQQTREIGTKLALKLFKVLVFHGSKETARGEKQPVHGILLHQLQNLQHVIKHGKPTIKLDNILGLKKNELFRLSNKRPLILASCSKTKHSQVERLHTLLPESVLVEERLSVPPLLQAVSRWCCLLTSWNTQPS